MFSSRTIPCASCKPTSSSPTWLSSGAWPMPTGATWQNPNKSNGTYKPWTIEHFLALMWPAVKSLMEDHSSWKHQIGILAAIFLRWFAQSWCPDLIGCYLWGPGEWRWSCKCLVWYWVVLRLRRASACFRRSHIWAMTPMTHLISPRSRTERFERKIHARTH